MEAVTAESPQSKLYTVRERVLSYIELTKPRIALMLVLSAAAGFYVGHKGPIDLILFANSMIGIGLLALGVATLNQWVERRTDSLMARTASRPLPTGRVSSYEALVFGVLLCVAAQAYFYFLVNSLTAILGLVVIVGYVLLYTPLKRITTLSTAIGAVPGAMPPLMGWTAAANEISLGAWALFGILFLWQFPHFLAIAWMYKEEYANAGIKMLPAVEPDGRITARQIVLFAIMLLPLSLAPFFLGYAGVFFLVGAALIGSVFLLQSIVTAWVRTVEQARRLLLASVLYLPIFYILLVLDTR
jgi:heme o synthase